jgi:hypothetical protein
MTMDRRTLLKAATTIAAAASLQRPLLAATPRELTLVDSNLQPHELRVARATPHPESRTIQPDLVRQWRDGLGREIALCRCARAYVRWDKALLLADLARESGLKVRQRRLDRSLFEVRITGAQI